MMVVSRDSTTSASDSPNHQDGIEHVLSNSRSLALSRHESRHSRLDRDDVLRYMDLEAQDNAPGTRADHRVIVGFEKGDPDNPNNWSMGKKLYVVLTAVMLVYNSTSASSLPSNAMPYIAPYFHIKSQQQEFLPISVYLIGYMLGPLVFSPMSEAIGRKPVMFWSFNVFIIFTLACALAKTWVSFLIFRLVCGTMASVPMTVIGGLYADIFHDTKERGRAMAMYMAGTMFGPILGPIISGFVSHISWRWSFWISLIIAGCSWFPLLFMPETFGPVILKKRAKRMRNATGNPNIFSPLDLETRSFKEMAILTLTRPLRMLFFEPIVLLNCLYISLVYAFFYLFFEAYPIIFEGIYQFSNKNESLAFLPVGLGATLAGFLFLYYDSIVEKAKMAEKPWARSEELLRLPVACVGGPFISIGLFWLGWSAQPSVHWIVPVLSGIPFGFGYLTIFIALINYLTDAYEIFAASAMAASSISRSIVGALLPLAAPPMYAKLGVHWATSLLGFLSLACVAIPFAFIHYGPRIRAKSKFCQYLLERKRLEAEKEEEKEKERLRGEPKGEVKHT